MHGSMLRQIWRSLWLHSWLNFETFASRNIFSFLVVPLCSQNLRTIFDWVCSGKFYFCFDENWELFVVTDTWAVFCRAWGWGLDSNFVCYALAGVLEMTHGDSRRMCSNFHHVLVDYFLMQSSSAHPIWFKIIPFNWCPEDVPIRGVINISFWSNLLPSRAHSETNNRKQLNDSTQCTSTKDPLNQLWYQSVLVPLSVEFFPQMKNMPENQTILVTVSST